MVFPKCVPGPVSCEGSGALRGSRRYFEAWTTGNKLCGPSNLPENRINLPTPYHSKTPLWYMAFETFGCIRFIVVFSNQDQTKAKANEAEEMEN